MNEKENNIIYTAKDIEQYLTGKLTALQMHAMEKAALDDDLLAEAIEGYSGLKTDEWKKELALLKTQFETKNSAKVIAFSKRYNKWWKTAAAVLLIGSTVLLAYIFLNKKEPAQIAQNVKNIIPLDSLTKITTKSDTVFTTNTQQNNLNIDAKNKADLITSDFDVAKETIKPDSNFIYKPGERPANLSVSKSGAEVTDDIVKSNASPVTTNAAPPAVSYNNTVEGKIVSSNGAKQMETERSVADKKEINQKDRDQQLNRVFAAQVVGTDNSPLPFANISIKSENFGTYADVKGNFRLVSSDSLLTVEVKAAGYQSQNYTLKSYGTQNKIVLNEEDFASRKKIIISPGNEAKSKISRRATLLKDSLVNAEPADGWDNYTTYVDNNIDIPDDILKKNLHGQVELSFDVKPNGSITNIKVDKSLCDNCDEAAKRLIQQGPHWKTKNGRKGKGKVTVQF